MIGDPYTFVRFGYNRQRLGLTITSNVVHWQKEKT